MSMASKAAQVDAAEPEKEAARALVAQETKEMVVKVDIAEEAKETPATPTMEDKVVPASMGSEEATKNQSQGHQPHTQLYFRKQRPHTFPLPNFESSRRQPKVQWVPQTPVSGVSITYSVVLPTTNASYIPFTLFQVQQHEINTRTAMPIKWVVAQTLTNKATTNTKLQITTGTAMSIIGAAAPTVVK